MLRLIKNMPNRSRDTPILHNRYFGKTHAAKAAHPEQMLLTEERGGSVEEWIEKGDSLGCPPKHKKLVGLFVLVLTILTMRGPATVDTGTTTLRAFSIVTPRFLQLYALSGALKLEF